MVQTTLNLFDLIVFAIVGLSAIMSFFRGFVREFLSLGTWVGATVITLYTFPDVSQMLKPHIKSETVASGFAGLFTFMGALVLLSIASALLMKFLKSGQDVGFINNIMGMIFGVARGTLLVAVGFYVFALTTDKEHYPEWMKYSFSLPYVETASAWVAHLAPGYLDELTDTTKKETMDKLNDALDDAKTRTDDVKEQVEDTDWPSMDDLKERMNANEPAGGGY